MVEIDWKKLMGKKPETLTEKEKDDLYETVAWYNPEFNVERKYLIHFVRIIQEVLKFKAEQVESLTNELDELADRQGKEEASKLHQYMDEIEQLREELEYHKKLDRSSGRSSYTSNEELKREMVKLEMQNEGLLIELREREKDLMNEKEEVEKYASQVATLEREKQELSRELRALQDEATERSARSLKDSPEFGMDKKEELTEIIRQKNKHISQLLEDIDVIEQENQSLRAKLTSIRDELSETTTHITEITAELSKFKHINKEYEIRNDETSERIKSLTFQIEELVEEKAKHDKQLDEYILTFNTKHQEWQEVVDAKDDEIMKLREENKKLSAVSMFTGSDVRDKLSKKISQQEEQILILQQELQKATEEINSSSELIEKLKEKQMKLISAPVQSHSAVSFLEEKIKLLEEKLFYAEEDAHAKAEEMSDLVIQLREYESGVFGLAEAVEKIKKLEKSIQEKDFQIEKLVEICNNLEIKLDNFEDQNMSLRERLGLSASDEIDTSGIKLRFKKDEELMGNLKLQLDRKEEELIKAKLKYRKVINYLRIHPPSQDVQPCPEKAKELELEEMEEKLQAIIKENDALRKGMHEILESIREQDCSGTVEVQSACLERLLEALDSRHVSGWYHPAMRLQAQLNTEEGKNEELRNQIRSLKTEEKKRSSELQNAYLKIQSMEMSTPRLEETEKVESEIIKSEEESEGDESTSKKSKINQNRRIIELESELQEMKMTFSRAQADKEKLEKTSAVEKENFLSKISELECQIHEYKKENPETKVPEMTSQVVVLERKVNFLKNLEAESRERNERLRCEMIEEEEKLLRDILRLQNEKAAMLNKIETLEEDILKSVPKEKFLSVADELTRLKSKHQHLISLALMKEENERSENRQIEISLLQDEKQTILEELRNVKEKLIAAEGLINEEAVMKGDFSTEISNLASKLAASEVRELNEKQKSTHLEKINEMLKSQQQEVESRNKELLEQVMKLTAEVERYQEDERALRAKAFSRITEEEESVLRGKIDDLERKCKELTKERDNVQELFEISQGQCRAFQEWKDADKILLASQNEQILLLQSGSDDRATISRLSHELAMAKLLTSEMSKKNCDLKMKTTKLLAQNVGLEVQLQENNREFFQARRKHLTLTEHLYQSINEIRMLYGGTVCFRDIEYIHKTKEKLKEKEKEVERRMKDLQTEIHEYSLKKEEMETQLESLDDLKAALKGETKNLVCWHNKSTELRLKEAKCRRQNEFLTEEMSQMENRVRKLNEEIARLEESYIEKEKEWERKQILWEEAQLQMCELVQEKGGVIRKVETSSDASTNTDKIFDARTFDILKPEDREASDSKIQNLEAEVIRLKKEVQEKNEIIMMKEKMLSNLNGKSKTIELEEVVSRAEKVENAEKEALKVTVQSLQNIIEQKEETIIRYQDLLKAGREEYSRACAKLQEELRGLNETLATQSKAYNKLKNAMQMSHLKNENIPNVVEKYITKIQELEEELRDCQMNLSSVNTQAYLCQQEVEKWKNLAMERLMMLEDMKQRMESERKIEMENHREEVRKYQAELDRLGERVELLQGEAAAGDAGKLAPALEHFQMMDLDNDTAPKADHLSDCTFDKPKKQKSGQSQREMESLKRQLKFSRDEATRLREQIRNLQARVQRRPKTTGSSTTRSDSVRSSAHEESLTSKIKHLEELLTVSKERERELMEMNDKKVKSAEEVARWDERKKSQQTIENLTSKLKGKETEVEILRNKNECFRNMVYKCERDKSILEAQLRAAKGGPGGVNARMEKLLAEKRELEAEVESLRKTLEEQLRHSGSVGAALLEEKLEAQERKLAAYELASRGQNAVVAELEKIKAENLNLEKMNLKLESENLALQLKLEKEKAETKCLLEKVKHCQEATEEIRRQETHQTVSPLHRTIEKLKEENKRLRSEQKEPRNCTLDKLRKDLSMLKEDHKMLRGKYMEAVDRNIALEDEVKSCRYQIHLMEEKDLAEVLTRTNNIQTNSELSQELIEVKGKLAHKTHLLNRVKTLLVKAAAKEKALLQKVSILQSMIPKSSLNVSG